MFHEPPSLTKRNFFRRVVVPALVVFLVPLLTWIFFLIAQTQMNAAREELRRKTEQQLANAREFEHEFRVRTFLGANTPALNKVWNRERYSHLMWVSATSIVISLAVCIVIAIAILCSACFRAGQYFSLLFCWYLLPAYAALQTVLFATLFAALFCWVTEYWFEFPDRLVDSGATIAVCYLLMNAANGMFRRYNRNYQVDGVILTREIVPEVWHEVDLICSKMETTPPDHLIAGIDANFFAIEWPTEIAGTVCRGKTVYLGLPLLKRLNLSEAHAILAHEMAHFTGRDTAHTARISPLLTKFSVYTQQLHDNLLTRPASLLINSFVTTFLLVFNKQRRKDEWRAEQIAAAIVSPRDVVTSLFRIGGYCVLRRRIESGLSEGHIDPENLDLPNQIDQELKSRALELANDPELLDYQSDDLLATHPTLNQLSTGFGILLSREERSALLSQLGDGGLYSKIPNAQEIEQRLWQDYVSRWIQYLASVRGSRRDT